MKTILQNLKRFFRVSILVSILVIIVLIGVGYLGIKQYQSYQAKKIEKEKIAQEVERQKDLEVEKLKQEVEALKNKEPQVIKQTILKEAPTPKTENDLSSIIEQWSPRIAYVSCYFYYIDGGLAHVQNGSGISIYDSVNQRVSVVTNGHVVTSGDDWNQWTPDYCTSQFLGTDTKLYYTYTASGDLRKHKNPSLDVAFLWFSSPSEVLKNVLSNKPELCEANKRAPIGSKVVVLGYPAIGSPEGITATEGIISGYDGDYYITSAKIEHGNSGGVAVLVQDNCYLGMPTLVVVGSIESLGRILDVNVIVP